MSERLGIGWRTAAALAATVVLLPLLVFVDIPESAAHEQTERRCDYDPVSGRKFNCRNVAVPHRHRPTARPPGWSITTTTPDTTTTTTTTTTTEKKRIKCGPGQHLNWGTTCHSHSFTPPCGTGTWRPGGHHSPVQKPPCRTTTTTTTPPTTTTEKQPIECPAGQHLNWGTTCHSHSFTPPCGTGTWRPGGHHSPVQKPPCPTTPPDDDEEEGDEEEGDDEGEDGDETVKPQRCITGAHRHASENRQGSSCHLVSISHCPRGQHEHPHGSDDCHSVTALHTDEHGVKWAHGCKESEHAHFWYGGAWGRNCHPKGDRHCTGGDHQHNHGDHKCHPAGQLHCGAGEHYHDGLGCHAVDVNRCPTGQHEHMEQVRHVEPIFLSCHSKSIVHHSSTSTEWALAGIWYSTCLPLVGAKGILAALAVACDDIVRKADAQARARAEKKNQDHDDGVGHPSDDDDSDDSSDDSSDDDSDDSSDDDSDDSSDDDSDDSSDDSSDDDSDDDSGSAQQPNAPQPDTTPEPEEVTPGDLARANRDWQAGRLTDEQMEAIKARFRCQLGITQYCK